MTGKNLISNKEPENSYFGAFCLFMTSWMMPSLVGYHFALINPIIPALQTMYNETYMNRYGEPMSETTWLGLLTVSVSSVIIGAFIGGVSSKSLLNFFTTKQLNQLAHVINLLSIAITALIGGITRSYEAFIIGRLIAGIPCGITYNVAPTLLAEMSARPKQGFWQSIVGVAISFGFFIAVVLAHPQLLGSINLWPVLVGLAVVPSFIYLISSLKIPQTPYYHVRMGRKDEAIASLRQLRVAGNKGDLDNEVQTIESEIGDTSVKVIGIKQILKTRQYRNQLFAVFALFANAMLCGVNNIILYSDLVFIDAGIPPEQATFATIGVFGLQFVMACCGSKLVDRYGGLKVNIGASIGLIVALTLFTVSKATVALAPTVMPFLSIVAAAIFMISWSGGTNLGSFALLGELTIEPTRATCFAFGNAVQWSTSWLVGFVPPYLQASLGAYSMVIWLVFTVLFMVYMILYIPDTKGKTTEEIQRKFKGKVSNDPSSQRLNDLESQT